MGLTGGVKLMQSCKNHSGSPAGFACEWCFEFFCKDCVTVKNIGTVQAVLCGCGGGCRPIEGGAVQAPSSSASNPYAAPTRSGSLAAPRRDRLRGRASHTADISYLSAFAYPFNLNGIILISIGSIFYWILSFFAGFSILGGLMMLLLSGYACAYFQKIIHSTSNGEHDLPDWPDITDLWSGIVVPGFQFVFCQVACMAPAIAYAIFVGPDLIVILLAIAGFVYLPIAILSITLNDSFLSMFNVHILIPAIGRIAPQYFMVWGFMIVLYVMVSIVAFAFSLMAPVIGSLISVVLYFYIFIVQFRMIGILYFKNEEQLDWF